MLNLLDVRNHTELGTGFSKDKMLNLCADEIEVLRQRNAELVSVLEKCVNTCLDEYSYREFMSNPSNFIRIALEKNHD